MKAYRILLAEDHILFRELIKKSLEVIPDIKVVGEVGDGLQILESAKILKPHMIILDIGMPGLSGIDAAKIIKQEYPKIKILLLTMYKSKDHLKQALYAKVDGYLLKENAFKDLITAIDMIRKGDKYISNIMMQKLAEYIRKETWDMPSVLGGFSDDELDSKENQEDTKLSPRESEILMHYAQGIAIKDIAKLLSINYQTVRSYMNTIKMKLHINNNIDLIKYAIKNNYISISS
jgi:two-component system nitrate/nitrite response regulator NarL